MTAAATNALAQGESAQGYLADPRNDGVLVYLNGAFVPRNEARVSIFDSGFVLGSPTLVPESGWTDESVKQAWAARSVSLVDRLRQAIPADVTRACCPRAASSRASMAVAIGDRHTLAVHSTRISVTPGPAAPRGSHRPE